MRLHWPKTFKVLVDPEGSQFYELAITLPVLLLIVVGIADFGQAFELRNKLSVAAREGARLAASESTLDLYGFGVPPSIQAVRDVVSNALLNDNVNQCPIDFFPVPTGNLQWTYFSGGCGEFRLTIDRSYTFRNGLTQVEGSHVTLQYPYTWDSYRVFGRLAFTFPRTINADAVMMNTP